MNLAMNNSPVINSSYNEFIGNARKVNINQKDKEVKYKINYYYY